MKHCARAGFLVLPVLCTCIVSCFTCTCVVGRYDAAAERGRGRRPRISLREVARTHGARHSEPVVCRGRPVQRQLVRNKCTGRTRHRRNGLYTIMSFSAISFLIIIMFMVLSSWQSYCDSSPGSFDECTVAPSGRRPLDQTSFLRL